MHRLLEHHLSEVAAHLSAMPAARRNEELREMRAHLENAVAVNRDRGLSEGQAVSAALEQFGAPAAVGHETLVAWRRGEALRRRDFWGAAASVLVFSQAGVRLLTPLLLPLANGYLGQNSLIPTAWLWLALLGYYMFLYAITGAVGGAIFPRQAVRGAAAGAGLSACLLLMRLAELIAHYPHGGTVFTPEMNGFALEVVPLAFAVPASWAGSRRWGRRARRLA
jgi:hypothetical protein